MGGGGGGCGGRDDGLAGLSGADSSAEQAVAPPVERAGEPAEVRRGPRVAAGQAARLGLGEELSVAVLGREPHVVIHPDHLGPPFWIDSTILVIGLRSLDACRTIGVSQSLAWSLGVLGVSRRGSG